MRGQCDLVQHIYRGWWVAQTLLHPQTLCCATNTLCFPQVLCVCHTPLFPIPKQKSNAKLPNHAQTLLHPQTLLCYKHPVFSTDFMCLPHTLISYLGTALVLFEPADASSLRTLCKPLQLPSTASKDWLSVLASSKRLFNSPGGHNFAKADTHI